MLSKAQSIPLLCFVFGKLDPGTTVPVGEGLPVICLRNDAFQPVRQRTFDVATRLTAFSTKICQARHKSLVCLCAAITTR